jgi:hypothetical protein
MSSHGETAARSALRGDTDPAFCGYPACDHHADSHNYEERASAPHVPCVECPDGLCVRPARPAAPSA